jgi:holo-[acyl-carrier protein] synthase
MHCIGIDIIEIARIEQAVSRWGERFLKRIYTQKELELYQGRAAPLAACFAGKEAVMKVLGTGIKGVDWQEIEILPDSKGAPLVYLHNKAQCRAEEVTLKEIAISLSHSREYAFASAIGAKDEQKS